MKQRPVIALVGRPNVGKSSLFNRFVGRRTAIVQDEPGVTRDRVYGRFVWGGRSATVIDTGGIDPYTTENIPAQMRLQAEVAMDQADVIVLVVDGREGLLPLDADIAALLRRQKKPVFVAVNKMDNPGARTAPAVYEFYELGLGEPIPVSAEHGRNTGALLDAVFAVLPTAPEPDAEQDAIKVAVVGRPNVGKSSLINALIGEPRAIVSDTPGTTRDVLDIRFEHEGTDFVMLDTAGLRRKARVDTDVEYYSVVRAIRAVEQCDVAAIVLDATEELSEQDKRIIGIAHEAGKGVVIVVNKWDKIDKTGHTLAKYEARYKSELAFVSYAPYVFISAKTGQRVSRLLDTIYAVANNAARRVTTRQLNEVVRDALAMKQPPSVRGVQPRIYYAVQAQVKPPQFVLFCSHAERLHYSYVRYIENRLRDVFGFVGTPIRIHLRERRRHR